jgi:hypothetical protein
MQVNELSYTSIHIQTKMEKVTGDWRELNEELIISSPNIIWVIIQRKDQQAMWCVLG